MDQLRVKGFYFLLQDLLLLSLLVELMRALLKRLYNIIFILLDFSLFLLKLNQF